MLIPTHSDNQYKTYESLIFERDQFRKEAEQIRISYIKRFGPHINAIYREKLACIKRKKTIAYCQRILNHGGEIDPESLQKHLQKEMHLYHLKLEEMLRDNEICQSARNISPEKAKQTKILYRRLAKRMHPDLHPELAADPALKELWQRITLTYELNDLDGLQELEVIQNKLLADLGEDANPIKIPDLTQRIILLQEEIAAIRDSKPYLYRHLLADEELIAKQEQQFEEELRSFTVYRSLLDETIKQLLNGDTSLL